MQGGTLTSRLDTSTDDIVRKGNPPCIFASFKPR